MANSLDSVIRVNVQTDVAEKFATIRSETAGLENKMRALKKATKGLETATKDEVKAFNDMRTQVLANKNAMHDMERQTLKTNNAFKKNSGFVAGVKKGMLSAATSIVGVGAAFMAIKSAFTGTLGLLKDFEQNLAGLSAITGATGSDLEFYADAAKNVGATTQTSALDFVDAIKLMGSAKPELLSNKEALVATTEAAVVLSEATGMELTDSTQHLGNTLNAFNLPASEAERVINTLAAASQQGAKEVPYLTEAMTKFGGIAASAGIGVEESVAAVEILGKKIPEASTAGNNMKNILTFMQIEAAKSGREFLGLTGELDFYADKVDDVTFLKDKFKGQNLLAIQTLIQERDALTDLQGNITGTNVAYEQQAIMGATLEGSLKTLTNRLQNVGLGMDGLKTIAANVVQGLIKFIDFLTGMPAFVKENRVAFIALGVAMVGLKLNSITSGVGSLASSLKGNLVKALRSGTFSMKGLNIAMKANPIGFIIGLIALLVGAFATLYNKSETVRFAIAGLFNAAKSVFFGIKDLAMNVLGGIGNILIGIFTLDKDRIKEGFNQSKNAVVKMGTDTADAFNEGYENKQKEEDDALQAKLLADAEAAKETAYDSGVVVGEEIVEGTADGMTKEEAEAEKKRQEAIKKAAEAYGKLKISLEKQNRDLSTNALTDDLERENQKIRDSYADKIAKQQQHLETLKLQQDEHGINTMEAQAIAQENIILLKDEMHLKIEDKTTQHNDKMTAKQDKQDEQDRKDAEALAKAKLKVKMDLFDASSDLLGAMGGLMEEESDAAKAFALLQIGIDTAKAISSLTAASEANPANAVTFGGAGIAQFLSGLARILVNIGKAKKLLSGGSGGGGNDGGGSDGGGRSAGYATVSTHEDGGIIEYARGGMVHGKRHSQGGEKFAVGGRVVELEGGEAVINRKSTARFRSVLSSINSYRGNGRKFAMGGMLDVERISNNEGMFEKLAGVVQAMGDRKVKLVEADVTSTQARISTLESDSSF